jgi:2-amino-4-hydroxy-6-hydroxymethyldihydropteridine diphosphokinase
MRNVILSLGSNIHHRKQYLDFGLNSIAQSIGKITKISSIYETEPIGFDCDTNFYNMCINVQSNFNPEEILMHIEKIESASGRKFKSKNKNYQSRTLDIDIISIEHITLQNERLTIPHPSFRQRKFVLLPLFEICPEFIDETTQKTIAQILNECPDNSRVNRLN